MGKIVQYNQPCPFCGSKDNVQYYEDGTGYCFGGNCKKFIPKNYNHNCIRRIIWQGACVNSAHLFGVRRMRVSTEGDSFT